MKIFFIGIKGSGMCALATLLSETNNVVLGSDVDKVFFTDDILINSGIKIVSFDSEQITDDIDLVILGNAFADDHPQVIAAQKKNIKVQRYFNFINEFANKKTSIAISGTNGKTTTTSLISSMFGDAKPNFLIGDGHGQGNIDSDIFIFEACEYKRTFLNYHPEITIINNIEMDHPDYFKNTNDVIDAFYNFAKLSKTLIVNLDDKNIQILLSKELNDINILTFSLFNENANLHIQNLTESSNGYNFDLVYNKQVFKDINVPFFGKHMLQNSLASILCGLHLNMNIKDIITNLSMFKGAKRRFEKYILNEQKSIILIDDYAHHPTSIDLVIKAIRQNYPGYTLNVLFQPHTFSRTIEFLDEFTNVLYQADNLYLEPIFGSIREQGNNNKLLLNENFEKKYPNTLKKSIEDIIDLERNNQIYLLVGAGDLDKKYISMFIEKFRDL